jgi:hypothetical protein
MIALELGAVFPSFDCCMIVEAAVPPTKRGTTASIRNSNRVLRCVAPSVLRMPIPTLAWRQLVLSGQG